MIAIFILILCWLNIKKQENEINEQSLYHSLLSNGFNAYMLYNNTNEYVFISMEISLSYMIADILIKLIWETNSKNRKLYILHHIGSIIVILIMYNSQYSFIVDMFVKLAFLGEFTNIFQKLWEYCKKTEYERITFIFFSILFLIARLILVPIYFYSIYRENTELYIIYSISFIFILLSINWINTYIKEYSLI